MPDFGLIQGAIASLKTAGDIASGFLKLKSIADVQGKVIELQSAILAAQSSALAAQSEQATMVQRIGDLEEEIRRVKAWEETKQRYELHQPTAGTFVYVLKKAHGDNPEPTHWICTNCYDNGRRSILQLKSRGYGTDHYGCAHCMADLVVIDSLKNFALG